MHTDLLVPQSIKLSRATTDKYISEITLVHFGSDFYFCGILSGDHRYWYRRRNCWDWKWCMWAAELQCVGARLGIRSNCSKLISSMLILCQLFLFPNFYCVIFVFRPLYLVSRRSIIFALLALVIWGICDFYDRIRTWEWSGILLFMPSFCLELVNIDWFSAYIVCNALQQLRFRIFQNLNALCDSWGE